MLHDQKRQLALGIVGRVSGDEIRRKGLFAFGALPARENGLELRDASLGRIVPGQPRVGHDGVPGRRDQHGVSRYFNHESRSGCDANARDLGLQVNRRLLDPVDLGRGLLELGTSEFARPSRPARFVHSPPFRRQRRDCVPTGPGVGPRRTNRLPGAERGRQHEKGCECSGR